MRNDIGLIARYADMPHLMFYEYLHLSVTECGAVRFIYYDDEQIRADSLVHLGDFYTLPVNAVTFGYFLLIAGKICDRNAVQMRQIGNSLDYFAGYFFIFRR